MIILPVLCQIINALFDIFADSAFLFIGAVSEIMVSRISPPYSGSGDAAPEHPAFRSGGRTADGLPGIIR